MGDALGDVEDHFLGLLLGLVDIWVLGDAPGTIEGRLLGRRMLLAGNLVGTS